MGEHLGSMSIEKRFCGPPDSGNGGYVCGRLADFVEGAAQVTLRQPPPLEKPLSVVRTDAGSVVLEDEGVRVADAVSVAGVELEVPEAPSFEEAQEAVKGYVGFTHHVFPTCFVCGPQREAGDGLCLFPGAVAGRSMVAAPFVPDRSLVTEGDTLSAAMMWAALDCPGAFAIGLGEDRFVVLGRLAAEIIEPARVGESCVVAGWSLGEQGRKLFAGTAVFGASGKLLARAKATWVTIDPATFGGLRPQKTETA